MKKESVRTKIIKAATDEINENGESFTIDNVAKRAGISKKTIYNNFENKKEIIFCVISDKFDCISEKRKDIINDTDMDIVEKIKNLITVIPFEFLYMDISKYGFIYKKYPESMGYIRQRYEEEWSCIEEYVSIAMKQGRIKRTDINAIKVVIMGTIYFYMTNRNDEISINEVASIILNGIKMK